MVYSIQRPDTRRKYQFHIFNHQILTKRCFQIFIVPYRTLRDNQAAAVGIRAYIELHGPSMVAVMAKIYGVIYNQSSSIAFLVKHLVIVQRQKATNISAFHWSPHGSLVSIGQHFITTRVVYLPKRTETSLITDSDISGSNHRIGPGCAGRT